MKLFGRWKKDREQRKLSPEGRGTLGGVRRGSSPRFVTLSVKEYALWAYAALPFNGRRSNLYES